MESGNHVLLKAVLCSVLMPMAPYLAASPGPGTQSPPAPQQAAPPGSGAEAAPPGTIQPRNPQPTPTVVVPVTLTGKITRDGTNLVLKLDSGAAYQLDSQSQVAPYRGRRVQITGKLHERSNILHIDTIHPAAG